MPHPLSAASQHEHGVGQVYPCTQYGQIWFTHSWAVLPYNSYGFRLCWQTPEVRCVWVVLPRRAMHASCDSPWHCSAKHHLLRAYLPRMMPFRGMLLTLRGGPQCLAPKAHQAPVYLKVKRHSSMPLARRTRSCTQGTRCCTRPVSSVSVTSRMVYISSNSPMCSRIQQLAGASVTAQRSALGGRSVGAVTGGVALGVLVARDAVACRWICSALGSDEARYLAVRFLIAPV
jgi:hypothetical protein